MERLGLTGFSQSPKVHAHLTHRQHSRRKSEAPNAPAQRRDICQDVQNFFGQECWVLRRSRSEGEASPYPLAQNFIYYAYTGEVYMNAIRPVSDLQDCLEDISKTVHESG